MERCQTLLALPRSLERRDLEKEKVRRVLSDIYHHFGSANFSSEILEQLPGNSMVVPLEGLYWSDWGIPDQVAETLSRIRRAPPLRFEATVEPEPNPVGWTRAFKNQPQNGIARRTAAVRPARPNT